MKRLIILIHFTLLFSCSESKKTESEAQTESAATEQSGAEKTTAVLTKYPTVIEMLEDEGSFSQEVGTLKGLTKSGGPVHVQVSTPTNDGDLELYIKEEVKRNIVYVAFQAFARTDINEITVTSVPIKIGTRDQYIGQYKMSKSLDREKAKSLLSRYAQTEDFQDLYDPSGAFWLPNGQFDKLKTGENLDAVFGEMK